MSVQDIDDKTFDKVEKSDKAILKFHADWCGPCHMLAPIYEERSEKMKDVDFFSIEGDKSPELSEKFGVMSFPTMILFEKGKEKDRIIGAVNGEVLEKEIKEKLGLK